MTKRTNKELLATGLKYLAGALPLVAIGPIVIFSAFNNREHPLYIPILSVGIIACIVAIFLMFKGIKLMMKALFD